MRILCCGGHRETLPQQRSLRGPNAPHTPTGSGLDNEAIVCAIMEALREKGLDVMGLFRVPGNALDVACAQEDLERGDNAREVLSGLEVETMATLFKKWLKRCQTAFDQAEIRQLPVEAIIQQLDPLLVSVLDFLAEVARHSSTNKMTPRSLATVFSPLYVEPTTADIMAFTQLELNPFIDKLTALISLRTVQEGRKTREEGLPPNPSHCVLREQCSEDSDSHETGAGQTPDAQVAAGGERKHEAYVDHGAGVVIVQKVHKQPATVGRVRYEYVMTTVDNGDDASTSAYFQCSCTPLDV